jgi:threonine aldolase
MRSFRSDNNAGLCPEALSAIAAANDDHQTAYGDDEWTEKGVSAFRALFGAEAAVFFVATGTAANTLAMAALTEPWQQILCHADSHLNDDESTAPERMTHCRIVAIRSDSPLLTPGDVRKAASHTRGDVHQPQPGVLSIANSTELGAVYTPSLMRALCETAHELGYRVHVDGARFANAVAAAGCDPRDLAMRAGVDALSFGGTKNGLAAGEAVIFFPRDDAPEVYNRAVSTFPFHRKGTGHLLSKHRFVTAPFNEVLRSGAWLRHAAHANEMAAALARGLVTLGYDVPYPTQANAVFVRLPPEADAELQRRGHGYYPFGPDGLVRLMCSFDTTPGDVEALLADAAEVTSGVPRPDITPPARVEDASRR